MPALVVFALGMLVPVVAFSRSGGAGATARSATTCQLGPIVLQICETAEPTTTTTTPPPTVPTITTPTTPVGHELVPALGKSAVVAPLGGIVRYRAPGGRGFVRLSGQRLIPIGSEVDTRAGKVGITSAALHGTQTGAFYSGMFKLRQPIGAAARAGTRKILTVLHLIGGSFRGCEADEDNRLLVLSRAAGFAARHRRHRVVRKLWGSEGGGGWGTVGGQAAGTVRGTVWLTEDTCLGTYVFVKRGVVMVHNRVNGKTVRVAAGHAYLARAPDPH